MNVGVVRLILLARMAFLKSRPFGDQLLEQQLLRRSEGGPEVGAGDDALHPIDLDRVPACVADARDHGHRLGDGERADDLAARLAAKIETFSRNVGEPGG